MKNREKRHETNEVTLFLINLFFLEVLGKFLVSLTMFILRLFGMEMIAQAYYAQPRHGFYTFFIILCIVTCISILRLAKMQRNK